MLKAGAYLLTDSIGLLSDAMESFINLVGALMALAMLTIAARPADKDHPYGHNKAEYFSSGVEGSLILIAAVTIGITAIERLYTPKPLEQIGFGLIVSVLASLINLFVALVLLKASKEYHSITLEADAQHLMTDVWTSVAVLIGVGMVALTGWERFDPIVALIVAGNIVWSGIQIIRKSILGLMDTALPVETLHMIHAVLDIYKQNGIEYHEILTRQSGSRKFVSFHLLVPGEWTVQSGHVLLECIEGDLCKSIPNLTVLIHLEPLDDPASWKDITVAN